MNSLRLLPGPGLLAWAVLSGAAAPASAQGGYRPGFINTSWQNNPYVYYTIHHRPTPLNPGPTPLTPPNPGPMPLTPANYPYPYPYPYPYMYGFGSGYLGYPVLPYSDGNTYNPTVIHNLYQSPPGSIDPIGEPPHTTILPPPRDNRAVVAVMLPNPQAQVWFDGYRTSSTGGTRAFPTPPLQPGRTYSYNVRAVWGQGSQQRSEERTVNVAAGQTSVVDFTRPAAQ